MTSASNAPRRNEPTKNLRRGVVEQPPIEPSPVEPSPVEPVIGDTILAQTRLSPIPSANSKEGLFPRVGDVLLDCKLLAELGRGAQGRVFLASQTSLNDRLVVLKVSLRTGAEHLNLAQLLHTHIVPLFFAQDLPDRHLRVLALPYLGGASLSAVLTRLQKRPRQTGQDLLAVLDEIQGQATAYLLPAFRARLAQMPYPSAVCLLGACLADALQHAHDHGLLHLDIKPGNILLSADGLPLLLDFHLARAPLNVGESPPRGFGGTPAYMPPEQRQVMLMAGLGQEVPRPVDHRADLFALGMVLYEMLALSLPRRNAEGRELARQLQERNPQVSTGLADMIARCLARDPRQRYASAALFAEDLRRHITHQPLRGVRNRDLKERYWKWRQQSGLVGGVVAPLLVCLTLLASCALVGLRWQEQQRDLEQSVQEAEQLLARDEAKGALRICQRGLGTTWFPGERGYRQQLSLLGERAVARIEEQQEREQLEQLATRLNALTEDLRLCWDLDGLGARARLALEQRCASMWQLRKRLLAQPGAEKAKDDLREIALLWSELHLRRDLPAGRSTAVFLLTQAERELGPCPALANQRQALSPGEVMEAAQPRTARDRWLLARSCLHAGKPGQALQWLNEAVALEPGGFWLHFYQGICAYQLEEYEQAVAAFRTCIALAPKSAPCYLNRALALMGQNRLDQAGADLNRALELAPEMASVWLQRGLLRVREGKFEEAISDLEKALEHGAPPGRTHYNLARVHHGNGDREKALHHVREALKHDPAHAGSRQLLDLLLSRPRTGG